MEDVSQPSEPDSSQETVDEGFAKSFVSLTALEKNFAFHHQEYIEGPSRGMPEIMLNHHYKMAMIISKMMEETTENGW